MNPPNLLLVASKLGYQTRVFAERARALGFDLQMATDRCHRLDNPWGDDAIPLRFDRPGAAWRDFANEHFDGIVAVGDKPAEVASHIAARLGLAFHPPEAVAATRNKFEARRRFEEAGLPVPEHFKIDLNSDPAKTSENVAYPCVLKPLGLSASRGVIRADSPAEFAAAFRRIRTLLSSPDIVRMHDDQDRYLLAEDFIPGREFAVEAIMVNGRLDILAIFDKPDRLDGPFFEETIYTTPSREPADVQEALRTATEEAVRAVGLRHGPVHAEMRVNQAGVWILEVAARPIGGLCASALRFADGGLEDLILRHAAGRYAGPAPPSDPARGVMMVPIPKPGVYLQTAGVGDAQSVSGVEDVVITAKEGQRLVPLPEGASYLGFIFARGDSADLVEASLRDAHARLRFEIASALPVI